MDAVVVRRSQKQSKVIMIPEASVINRSITPPKVQFVPAHINIWAPQAQQQLLRQHGSKGSRPQSAHGMVHKGLPITAVSLQSLINVKNQASLTGPSNRPSSAPVLTFSRTDVTNAGSSVLEEATGPTIAFQPTMNDSTRQAVTSSGSGDNQRSQKLQPGQQPVHSRSQRPITPDFRNMHLDSIAQHSQKRPMSCQNRDTVLKYDTVMKLDGQSHQQKHTEIETFDSGGDSDTETFAHTRLATASCVPSRPPSSSLKRQQLPEPHRPYFGYSIVPTFCFGMTFEADAPAACQFPPVMMPISANLKYLKDFPKNS
jgi:hypothetical protein